MKNLINLLLLLAIGYLALLVFVYSQQRNMMYFPERQRILPADIGLADVDEIELRSTEEYRLYCWYGKAKSGQPTILFFHGNGGSIANRDWRFRQLMEKGFGIFMLGYPGYGGSEGTPAESSFHSASRLAYDFLISSGIDSADIVIYGESIGTGVAVALASRSQARALILEAPMLSAEYVAQQHYPLLPIKLLLKDKFLSIEQIDQVAMPLLIIHGDHDRLIDIENSRRLFTKAQQPKTLHVVRGAGHNNLGDYPILEVVEVFLSTT